MIEYHQFALGTGIPTKLLGFTSHNVVLLVSFCCYSSWGCCCCLSSSSSSSAPDSYGNSLRIHKYMYPALPLFDWLLLPIIHRSVKLRISGSNLYFMGPKSCYSSTYFGNCHCISPILIRIFDMLSSYLSCAENSQRYRMSTPCCVMIYPLIKRARSKEVKSRKRMKK